MKRSTYLVFGGVVLAACRAQGSVTALVNIPIADILSHRAIGYNYAASGTAERDISKGINHAQGMEIGLFDRIELGWDNDFMGNHLFNVKAQLVNAKDGAISAGVMNWRGKDSTLFVVGRHDFADFRLHGGLQRIDGKWLTFLGMDGACGKKGCCKDWTWMAEYLNGASAKMDVGLNIPLPFAGLSIMPTFSIPVNNGNGHVWTVYFNYGTRF